MNELLIDEFYAKTCDLLTEMSLTLIDFNYDETNFYFEICDELDSNKVIYKFKSANVADTLVDEETLSSLVLAPLFDEIIAEAPTPKSQFPNTSNVTAKDLENYLRQTASLAFISTKQATYTDYGWANKMIYAKPEYQIPIYTPIC